MKRVLWVLLLAGSGFLLLQLLAGDQQVVDQGAQARSEPRPPDRGPPIRVGGTGEAGLGVQILGAFRIGQHRNVKVGDAMVRMPIYDLACTDSRPLPDGRHRLFGVQVALFDDGVHVADLAASEAVLELREDRLGQRSVSEDKEIELQDVVFTTRDAPGVLPLRIEVGRVDASIRDALSRLDTPSDDEQVTVVVGGDRPARLTGRGLHVAMPRTRAPGARLELQVASGPRLHTDDLTITAQGAMLYVEELHSGGALLRVERDVQVELTAAAAGRGAAQIRGDRLRGWLQRAQHTGGNAAARGLLWSRLLLDGAPARVDTDDFALASPTLRVVPGPGGQPFVISAGGGDVELQQRSAAADAVTFATRSPLHLVRPGEWLGAVHRAFGFPASVLRPVTELEVLVLEGAPDLTTADSLRVHADQGLRVYRMGRDDDGTFARGYGRVRIEHGAGAERIVATGDDGMTLRRSPGADTLQLGSDDPSAAQEFVLEQGEALQLRGRGACRLDRHADGRVQIDLRSSAPSLHGRFDAVGAELHDASELHASWRGRELLAFATSGPGTWLQARRQQRELQAHAPRIERQQDGSFRLFGNAPAPARLLLPATAQSPRIELLAPNIDLHRITAATVLVDGLGEAQAPARLLGAEAPATAPAGAAGTVTARRIRLLPFAIGPAALLRHQLGLPRGLADAVAAGLGNPWLLAQGEVVADLTDVRHGELHGEAELLAIDQADQSALLIGDAADARPAHLRSRQADGREATATGARLLCFRSAGEHVRVMTTFPDRQLLVRPRVTLRDPRRGETDPFANLQGECTGEIEVLTDSVLFHGPVAAHSLLPDGSEDPRGPRIVAQQLVMFRGQPDGAITRVQADGGVAVDWDTMHARSRWLELDLRAHRCTARDPEAAEIRFANGRSYKARQLEANYVTRAVRSYHGQFVQDGSSISRR